jgi:lysyl-tRNA synthetase class 2
LKKIIITDDLFDLYPDFYRGIIFVGDLVNQKSYKRIRKLLRSQVESRSAVDLSTEERLLAWDRAHETFGSDPNRHPPSVRALIERIKVSPNLPFINSVVALFNVTSLKYLIPCGGDDIDRVEGDLMLGPARGDETFLPLGGGDEESPLPGEIIYYDAAGGNVLCRRWNWRNGDRTKIEVESKRLVINVDGLPPVTPEAIDQARDELAALLEEHCRAKVTVSSLHRGRRQFEIPEKPPE